MNAEKLARTLEQYVRRRAMSAALRDRAKANNTAARKAKIPRYDFRAQMVAEGARIAAYDQIIHDIEELQDDEDDT